MAFIFPSAVLIRACIGFYYCLNLGIWELFLELNLSIVLRMKSDELIFLSLKHLFVIHSVSITIFRNRITDVKSPREEINIAKWIMHFLRNANRIKKKKSWLYKSAERYIYLKVIKIVHILKRNLAYIGVRPLLYPNIEKWQPENK